MDDRLFNRDFTLLWCGQLVSNIGSQALTIAIMYWLMEATGSATRMGLFLTISMLPTVLLGPIGGAFADRHSRRAILIISDLASGVSVLGLAWLFLRGGLTPDDLVTWVLLVGAAVGTSQAFFRPAVQAATPDIVPARRLAGANALLQLSLQTSGFVGQALGGLAYRWLGAPLLFVIDGVSYLVSALSEAFIRIPRPDRGADATPGPRAFQRDLVEGFRYVRDREGMLGFMIGAAALNFFIMPIVVLLPFYVDLYLGAGAAWYGFLLAALSAGSIVGTIVAGSIPIPSRARSVSIGGSMIGAALLMGALGSVHAPGPALAIVAAVGVLTGYINVLVATLVQASTPSAVRGRVTSVLVSLASGVTPLGLAIGGLLGDLTDKNVPLVYAVCGIAAAVSAAIAILRPSARAFLASAGDAPEPSPAVEAASS